MIPALYGEREGGEWKRWPPGLIPPINFYSRRAPSPWTYVLFERGMRVAALVTPQGYRWDWINGWTGKTFAEAA